MALILNIDSSTGKASVCLALDGSILAQAENADQMDHAAWLHPAIDSMLSNVGYKINQIQAIAVTSGPGSYTGLRVGMSAAKGICYALDIPLITENTLRIMAMAAINVARQLNCELICPMIDARRMEVFTAIYDLQLGEVGSPQAMILEPGSFKEVLGSHSILFVGNGIEKWKQIGSSPRSFFAEIPALATYLAIESHQKFQSKRFTDLRYSEPVYLKEFYTHAKK